MFQTCFLEVWRLPEVRPVGFHPRTHQGPHFQSAAATVENVGIGLARPGTVRIHRKTPSRTPGTLGTDIHFHGWGDFYPSKTTWINITRLIVRRARGVGDVFTRRTRGWGLGKQAQMAQSAILACIYQIKLIYNRKVTKRTTNGKPTGQQCSSITRVQASAS